MNTKLKDVYLNAVLWSSANKGVVRSLIGVNGDLDVYLVREPANPVDAHAVAVIAPLDRYVVGGVPMGYAHGIGQLIGYIRRSEPRRSLIIAMTRATGRPVEATLRYCGEGGLVVRIPGDALEEVLDDGCAAACEA